VRIAETDIALGKNLLKEARSDYLPTLRTRMNSEYLKGLGPDTPQGQAFQVVNDTSLVGTTRFQSSVTLQANWLLWDTGSRLHKGRAAKAEISAKEAILAQRKREVLTSVLDAYVQALMTAREIPAKSQVLALQRMRYDVTRRLYEAGAVGKVDLADQAIEVARSLSDIEALRERVNTALVKLGRLTHQHYDPNAVQLLDLAEEDWGVSTDTVTDQMVTLALVQSPDVQQYQHAMARKQEEIRVLQRQRFPTLSAYSSYGFFGSDPNDFWDGWQSFSQRNFSVGVQVVWPVFDAFKNRLQREKIQLEMVRLGHQQALAADELKEQIATLHVKAQASRDKHQAQALLLERGDQYLSMLDRLDRQGLAERRKLVQERIERVQEAFNEEKLAIEQQAAQLKLAFYVQSHQVGWLPHSAPVVVKPAPKAPGQPLAPTQTVKHPKPPAVTTTPKGPPTAGVSKKPNRLGLAPTPPAPPQAITARVLTHTDDQRL
jgi:outer membrane protein